eukprot:TRINITY_DN66735_c0_g1_i1.p1 TRINITY_DN66735_c0_g1~~TRINITY_DN66735_c0_g1_i1.p1  ORF type:complete len:578 (+),score=66.58 TRINITY_DN66735_c0_g1_i1:64-1797(+)
MIDMSSPSNVKDALHQRLKEQALAAERLAMELKRLCDGHASFLSTASPECHCANEPLPHVPQLDGDVPCLSAREIGSAAESDHVDPPKLNDLHGLRTVAAKIEATPSTNHGSCQESGVETPKARFSSACVEVPEGQPVDLDTQLDDVMETMQSLPCESVKSDRRRSSLTKRSIFVDAEVIKLSSQRDSGETIYADTGFCQKIVKHPAFEKVTFRIVILSCLWVAIELDWNTSASMYDANPVFPVVSNFLCIFFILEIVVRIAALKRKALLCLDRLILFDICLVILIVVETWLMPILLTLVASSATTDNMSALAVAFKALRLLGVLRLGRVVRELPELLIIWTGIRAALRGIGVLVVMLMTSIYLAAIIFRVLLDGTDFGTRQFASIPHAMGTLLIDAALSGSKGANLLRASYAENFVYAAIMMAFVLYANILMMGMIVAMLVQTVRAIAEAEKYERSLESAHSSLDELWDTALQCDDGDGVIDRNEMLSILRCVDAQATLETMGVDLDGLDDTCGFVMDQHSGRLSKQQFKKMILDLRSHRIAKVKDHVETRKFISNHLKVVHDQDAHGCSVRPHLK